MLRRMSKTNTTIAELEKHAAEIRKELAVPKQNDVFKAAAEAAYLTAMADGEVGDDEHAAIVEAIGVLSVGAIIEWASAVMTLLPGDLILTGTPEGVGPIEDGDIVSVTIEGIGTLSNPVVRKGKS